MSTRNTVIVDQVGDDIAIVIVIFNQLRWYDYCRAYVVETIQLTEKIRAVFCFGRIGKLTLERLKRYLN